MAVKIARWIMLFCALSAIVAFISGFENVVTASINHKIVELWRLLGFIVFAGILTLLAFNPTRYTGIWELVIFHKLGMAVFALVLVRDNAEGAGFIGLIDGILAILIIISYFLSKGYASWGSSRKGRTTQVKSNQTFL
ncbi:hypothetical protein KHA93_16060 [Bacillus sp. FJAT-49732]|uniref:Uncharacterized protein n=1 Tax=Lederbergia citrisecunda TaxID=2833583 RepID=A0A942YM70_9BACI|nr:hypothetical protein [Lederbergia citrisecunda]MBS4201154.1 hypothetical protein [Lederbergia citrisecunda]